MTAIRRLMNATTKTRTHENTYEEETDTFCSCIFVSFAMPWSRRVWSRASYGPADNADAGLVGSAGDAIAVDHQRLAGVDRQCGRACGFHRLDRRHADHRHVETHVLVRLRHLDDRHAAAGA